MFKGLKRIVYPVSDLLQARQWYSEILEMQPAFETPFVVIFRVGDCSLSLTKRHEPLPERAVEAEPETYWEVDDLDATYQRLLNCGAAPHTPIKAVINIRIAKVIDPFGNILGLTGAVLDAQKRSVEHQPSETANVIAFCRALAAKEEREAIKGPDYLAELFLTDEGRKPLQDQASRSWAIKVLATAPLYSYVIARTAFIEDLFKQALADQIPQIVFLGAGYDTRPYRHHASLGNSRIFELDIEPTQKHKREILKNANIEIPPQVTLVSINFRSDKLDAVLSAAGFDPGLKTLFIWEGVTYYLTEEAIITTLRFIKQNAPAGSTLCFDYAAEQIECFNPAEPFQFWIDPERIGKFLEEHGFSISEHLDATEMEKRYLTLQDGTLAENVLTRFRLIEAMT